MFASSFLHRMDIRFWVNIDVVQMIGFKEVCWFLTDHTKFSTSMVNHPIQINGYMAIVACGSLDGLPRVRLISHKIILFENQIQTTSASPYRTQVQLASSFLVCSLIFIEYQIAIF